MTTDPPPTASDPGTPRATVLAQLAPTLTERALVLAAEHHAERVLDMLRRGELPARSLTLRTNGYARLAKQTYEYLRDNGAYAHLSTSHPQPVTVHPDQITAWLTTPTTTGDTVADAYGIDDTFTLGDADLHDRIQELVARACADTVLNTADHRLHLWQVADEGFLLTVDPPHGPRLSSHHLPIRTLLPAGQCAVPAAVAVLTETAHQANIVLSELAQQLPAARASAANPALPDNATPALPAGRAFPAPGSAAMAAGHAAPLAGPPPTSITQRHR
jgi:hypothetical protein